MAFTPRRRPVPVGGDGASSDAPAPVPAAAPEQEWVARIRAGDQAAFEAMFRAYYDGLCRSVAGYLGTRDAAEDVVQGVFARIWRDRTAWAVTNLRHYLYTAVRRSATSHFRHAAVRQRAAPVLMLEASGRAEVASADAELEAEELRHRLERALASLPPRTREAFVLSRGEGMSYNEVAVQMEISPKTVGVHIGKALALLRKLVLVLTAAAALFSRIH